MLYEALTGRRPFSGASMDLLLAHLFNTPTPPSVVAAERGVVRPTLDWPRLDAIVLKMLAKERADRYQDCQLLIEDLTTVWPVGFPSGVSLGPPSSATPTESATEAPPTRRRFLAAGIVGVSSLGVALGLAAWWWRRPGPPRTLAQGRRRAAEMVQAAERGTPAERSELLLAIAGARSRALTAVVVRALGDEHSGVAQAALLAALAVGQQGDAQLAAALQQLAGQAIGATAVEIAVARAQLGDDAARPLLVAAAASPAVDATTRLRATLALAEVKQAPAALLRVALSTASKSESLRPALRRAALTALVRLHDGPTLTHLTEAKSAPTAAERLEAAAVLAAAGQPAALAPLLRAAQAAEGSERIELCALLAEVGDSECLPLLPAMLRSPQPELRQRTTVMLALIGRGPSPAVEQAVAPLLLPLLQDPDPRVALTAAVALLSLPTAAPASGPAADPRDPTPPDRKRA